MNKEAEEAEAEASSGRGALKGFFSYKNTFDKDSVWLDIPKHGMRLLCGDRGSRGAHEDLADEYCIVVFVDNSDPYVDDLEALHESEAAVLAANANSQAHDWNGAQSRGVRVASVDGETQGLEALSTAATHDRFSYPSLGVDSHQHHQQPMSTNSVSPFNPNVEISPTVSSGPSPRSTLLSQASPPVSISSSNTAHNNNNINFLLNPSNSLSPPVDPNLQQQSTGRRSSSLTARPGVSRNLTESRPNVQAETDFEVAYLLRHYAEAPGLW